MLDVLQALIGPDVLALQTMLFLKPPGKPGQGWHQDSYYIPTHPDTLCGAWIAIDDCDELNGAMWFAAGSQHEPVYPPEAGYGYGDRCSATSQYVGGVSNPDDDENDLARIADRYPQLLVAARPATSSSSAATCCTAASGTARPTASAAPSSATTATPAPSPSGAPTPRSTTPTPRRSIDPVTRMTNGSHILARGDTHLPFARPRFGTPCAALLCRPRSGARRASSPPP